ncbi:MAG: polyphosphate kinase 1 [Aggregatilineales bacterium]
MTEIAATPPVIPTPDTTNWYDPALYINRELSWLEFNQRCLMQSFDPELPLLERVRFLSIFSNNLDEFFMVRVSGLKEQVAAGVTETPADGLTPQQQLTLIREGVLPMLAEQRRCFHELLVPKLAENGIDVVMSYSALTKAEKKALAAYFETEVFPVLTPLAVDPGRPFPHISNLSLSLAVLLRDTDGSDRFARIKVPNVLSRVVSVQDAVKRYGSGQSPESDGLRYIFLETLIRAHLDLMFPGMRVVAASAFRITRDTDMDITEEEASDLLETIEEGVRLRRFGQVVRMTIAHDMPDVIREVLVGHLHLQPEDVYQVREPLGMNDLSELANVDVPTLKSPPYIPQRPSTLPVEEDIYTSIRRQDILLHHPYDSFLPVVEFFERAAVDPQVLAIKTTLYRTGQNSPIVHALLKAQEHKKQVAVLVELKARFDEENNIGWARALESEGVHVIYGLMGLKTHSKISMVVRRESDGVHRYVHLSTGNYNAFTARIYTDLGLFTCREDIAADASELFNRLTGYSFNTHYRKLLIAPEHLRSQMTALIEREIGHARAGRMARLIFKMNSLVDPPMIRLLYEASQAGVQIDLMVRSICCLRPGIPGVSDRIRVTCLIGRFLEHSRVFYFQNGDHPEIYLGSADLMQRNLDHRVETVFPIESEPLQQRIVDEVLGIEMADTVKAQMLMPDGTYRPVIPAPGVPPLSAQRWFMEHGRDH